MRPQSRKSYHHGDLRNALLRAALELVQETGSTHFSLRDVTERIGVSPTSPTDGVGRCQAAEILGMQH